MLCGRSMFFNILFYICWLFLLRHDVYLNLTRINEIGFIKFGNQKLIEKLFGFCLLKFKLENFIYFNCGPG